MKTFFLRKNTPSSSLSNFFHIQSFLTFCEKNLIIRAEMTFLRNITVWYAFYSKFATFRDFEKNSSFSGKTHLFFQKRPKFRMFWEILLFQSHSTANLLQFGEKIFSHSVAWTNLTMWRERNWQTLGKKTSEMAHLRGRFCFLFLKNMAQNNNVVLKRGDWH